MYIHRTEAERRKRRDIRLRVDVASGKARAKWRDENPRCPHCGHAKPLPFYLRP